MWHKHNEYGFFGGLFASLSLALGVFGSGHEGW